MHVILISNRMASTRSINVSGVHLAAAVAGLVLAVILLSFFIARSMSTEKIAHSGGERGVAAVAQSSLQSLATRVGELQAKVLELDALGERLSALAGIKPTTFKPSVLDAPTVPLNADAKAGGQGGPLIIDNLQSDDLEMMMDSLSRDILKRSNHLQNVEIELLGRKLQQYFMPTESPIPGAEISSNFGSRVDPITGGLAFHRGIDLPVPTGTSVESAAAGIVVKAEYHGEYGKLVEIDHGNGFSTRYAHLSDWKVNVGQVVKRGHAIALSGNSGRSTGPHLHFEVLVDGVQQNPMKFLERGKLLLTGR